MITTAQMYWIVILDNITITTAILSILFTAGTIVAFIFAACEDDHWWLPSMSLTMMLVFVAVATFVPSTKQMAAILVVPKMANNEKLQTVGNKLYELAVEWMDELRPKYRHAGAMSKVPGGEEK